MMNHEMGLFDTPFKSIRSGRKIVEARLHDEKRRKIEIDDTITFTRVPENDDSLTVEVIDLETYPTFREMYEHVPAAHMDAVGESLEEMVEQTYEIYTPERENEWGTVAITIKLQN